MQLNGLELHTYNRTSVYRELGKTFGYESSYFDAAGGGHGAARGSHHNTLSPLRRRSGSRRSAKERSQVWHVHVWFAIQETDPDTSLHHNGPTIV